MPIRDLGRLLPLWQTLRRSWQDVLAVVYPQVCLGCGAYLLESERAICTGCLHRLPLTNQADSLGTNRLVHRLGPPIVGAAALGAFEGLLPSLIHRMKYADAPQVGFRLGQLLGEALHNQVALPQRTLLVPIPLHRRKLNQRGYNQAQWIANGIARAGGWKVDTQVLRRTRHTPSQTGLDQAGRHQNVAGAFQVRARTLPEAVALVDDVLTTGATIRAAADALHRAGVRQIYVLALADVGS